MAANPRQFFIQGVTRDGKTFRPSDWADRLCGVMAQFRPEGDTGDPRFTYSPYVRPVMSGGIRSVFVDERLREIEPKALDFVLNFAHDNNLQLVEACIAPCAIRRAKSKKPVRRQAFIMSVRDDRLSRHAGQAGITRT
jgi:hypothetical protein